MLTVAENQAAAITHDARNQAEAMRQAAEQEAATIRQQATDQAAAVRQAAEREAAELKAVLLAMSGEMGRVAAHVTENLPSPGGLATMPAPAIAPPRPRTRPDTRPDRPAGPARPRTRPDAPGSRPGTRPDAPAARPAGPAAPPRPGTAPARTPQKQGRQQKAMRIAASITAATFLFAVGTGLTEAGLHGFKFFVFRQTGTGETGQPDTETDQQFQAQQAAAAHHATAPTVHHVTPPKAHHVATPKGRHATKAH